jgi:hypothetical protein
MLMLTHLEREKQPQRACVSWNRDGRTFVVRDKDAFAGMLLPLFFRQAKFQSFTRKLYRWGFRQISVQQDCDRKDRMMIFGNEYFQRDKKSLMANMKSVTAAGTRRSIEALSKKKKSQPKRSEGKKNVGAAAKSSTKSCPGGALEKLHTSLVVSSAIDEAIGMVGPDLSSKASPVLEQQLDEKMRSSDESFPTSTSGVSVNYASSFVEDGEASLRFSAQQDASLLTSQYDQLMFNPEPPTWQRDLAYLNALAQHQESIANPFLAQLLLLSQSGLLDTSSY